MPGHNANIADKTFPIRFHHAQAYFDGEPHQKKNNGTTEASATINWNDETRTCPKRMVRPSSGKHFVLHGQTVRIPLFADCFLFLLSRRRFCSCCRCSAVYSLFAKTLSAATMHTESFRFFLFFFWFVADDNDVVVSYVNKYSKQDDYKRGVLMRSICGYENGYPQTDKLK